MNRRNSSITLRSANAFRQGLAALRYSDPAEVRNGSTTAVTAVQHLQPLSFTEQT